MATSYADVAQRLIAPTVTKDPSDPLAPPVVNGTNARENTSQLTPGDPASVAPRSSTTDVTANPAPPTGLAPISGVGNSGDTTADFDYGQKINDIFKNDSQLDSDAKLQEDRTKSDLNLFYQQAAQNYKKAKKTGLDQQAGKGMLKSGATVENQADIAQGYTKDVAAITQSGQRSFEDLARATVARKQALEQQRLDAETQLAAAKAQKDLNDALIASQTKAYNDFKAGLLSQHTDTGGSETVNLMPTTGVGAISGNDIFGNPIGSPWPTVEGARAAGWSQDKIDFLTTEMQKAGIS